jgi:hypothetical protein
VSPIEEAFKIDSKEKRHVAGSVNLIPIKSPRVCGSIESFMSSDDHREVHHPIKGGCLCEQVRYEVVFPPGSEFPPDVSI